MRLQAIQQPSAQSVKTGGMWCALSLCVEGRLASYLGSKRTSIHASAFTARNTRNPEADTKAALD